MGGAVGRARTLGEAVRAVAESGETDPVVVRGWDPAARRAVRIRLRHRAAAGALG
ncbi:hypothetical protein ACFVWN_10290 [Nocardiopsis flavescens]|uniref:hypothetical protein n=1 Tax=Nocardiopsis flavescens TaxID=758803 RepID=UPI003666C1BC